MTLPRLVPAPTFAFKPMPGGFAAVEDIVTVRFAEIRYPDGRAVTASDYLDAHAVLTRAATVVGPIDVWDARRKRWRPGSEVDLDRVSGLPLVPPEEGASPWQGGLAAAAGSDVNGEPIIRTAGVSGFPQYRVRGVFRAVRDGVDAFGSGPEGAPLQFASRAESARFAARLTPDAESATRVQIMLRNAAGRSAGMIEIDASGADAVLSLRSFDAGGGPLASVSLESDGVIRLTPGAGQKVLIDGDLEAGRIHYLPASGLPKKTLD